MTQLKDIIKTLRASAEQYKQQLEAKGLTDRQRIPTPTKCTRCDGLIAPRWLDKPFGHWQPASDADCLVCVSDEERSAKQAKVDASVHRARVPIPLRGLSLADMTVDRTSGTLGKACKEWDGQRWLVASGGVGTGKTTWLTATMLDALRGNPKIKGLWTSEQRLYRKAQLHGEARHSGRERVVQEAIDADLLLLDDLGAARRDLTEWQGGAMRDLLMERHLEGRATLVSTNLSVEAIEQRYGDHVASRMIEASGGLLNLGGADRRRHRGNAFLSWWSRGM